MSSQPGSVGTRCAAKAACRAARRATAGTGMRRVPSAAGDAGGVEQRLGGEVERAGRPAVEHPHEGVGDVVGVDERHRQVGSGSGSRRASAPGQQPGGAEEQRAEEVAADLAAGLRLEDQRGPRDDGAVVPGCRATCRTTRSASDLSRLYWALGMPVVGQSSVTRLADGARRRRRRSRTCARTVRRRRRSQRGRPGGSPPRSPAQVVRAAAGLQRPGQVDDGVHAVHEPVTGVLARGVAEVGEVPPDRRVRRDVRRRSGGPGRAPPRRRTPGRSAVGAARCRRCRWRR